MIETKYKLTFEQWSEAQDLWCKPQASRLPATRLLTGIYYAITVTAGFALSLTPHWPGGIILLLLITQSSIVSWRRKRLRRDLYSRTADRDREVSVRIDEGGYESIRPGFNECRMSWNCFTGWKEGQLTFILGRALQYCSVPKSALTPEQINQLRSLLIEKLG